MTLIVTLVVAFALGAALATFLIVQRDFSTGRTAALAAGAGAAVGICFLFALYLAVVCFIAAALAYVVMRALLRSPGIALMSGLAVFAVLALGSFAAISIALDSM